MRLALAGLAALAVSQGIGRFAMTPILPMMQEEGLSLSEGGWLAAANYLGYLVGALSTIWLRLNPSVAIRAALLAILALAGVAGAWVLVFVSAWTLERLAEARRPQLAGLLYAGVGIGVTIAGIVCLLGFAVDTNWIALGAIALATAGATWAAFSFKQQSGGEEGDRLSGGWLLIFCYGAYGFGYIVPATFLPAMARQIVSDPLAFGSAWPVLGIAAAASTLIASRLGSTNPRRVWAVCMVLLAIGVAAPL